MPELLRQTKISAQNIRRVQHKAHAPLDMLHRTKTCRKTTFFSCQKQILKSAPKHHAITDTHRMFTFYYGGPLLMAIPRKYFQLNVHVQGWSPLPSEMARPLNMGPSPILENSLFTFEVLSLSLALLVCFRAGPNMEQPGFADNNLDSNILYRSLSIAH